MELFTCDFCSVGPLGHPNHYSSGLPEGWVSVDINVNYTGIKKLHCCDACKMKYHFEECPVVKESILEALEALVIDTVEQVTSQ